MTTDRKDALPTFRYHPDPIASGSIAASDATCACCGLKRGFVYQGAPYSEHELDDAICPWCIADGAAHRKFGAYFTDPTAFPDDIAPEVADEVAHRTPGFSSWQQGEWLTCCGDASAFREPVGYDDIRARYPQLEGTLMMYIVHELELSGAAATRFLKSLHRDQGPTAYVFTCRHCDGVSAYIDFL